MKHIRRGLLVVTSIGINFEVEEAKIHGGVKL